MDAYSKTWLQFVLPVYIWVLVGLMIIFSHYSNRFANLQFSCRHAEYPEKSEAKFQLMLKRFLILQIWDEDWGRHLSSLHVVHAVSKPPVMVLAPLP